MQAVILVGGEGTRLRPLTSTVPKPVVPLVDRPFIAYMLEWLARHGVDDVVMSCGFLATAVRNVLGDGTQYGLRLRFVEEPEPRGTAGALKYAEDLLDERFLMLNGDVLTDIDLTAQIAQHDATGAVGTLALVRVADPTAYGLVRLDDDHSVKEFVEKPSADQIDTDADLGRRLRARALGARPHPARSQRLDRARGVAAARRRRASTATPRRPTGWTSARPSATCRAPSTSSRATSRRPWPTASGPATWRSATACSPTGASCRRRSSSAAARSRQARTSARWSCWARASAWGRARRSSARWSCNGAEIGAGLRAARLHRRRRRARRRGLGDLRRRRARRGRDGGGAQRPHARRASLSRRRTCPKAPSRSEEGRSILSSTEQLELDRETIGRIDPTDQLTDVLAIPEHLRDALWKVESAGLEPWDSPGRPRRGGHGRLGHRRPPRPRHPRRSRLAPAAGRARLRTAAVDDARHHRPLRLLLGQHRGDARLLRGGGRDRRAARRRHHRRQAGRARARRPGPGGAGRGRLPAARRGRLHDGRRAAGRRAVRRRPAA